MVPCYGDCAGMEADDHREELRDLRKTIKRLYGENSGLERQLAKAIALAERVADRGVKLQHVIEMEVEIDRLKEELSGIRAVMMKLKSKHAKLRTHIQKTDEVLDEVEACMT